MRKQRINHRSNFITIATKIHSVADEMVNSNNNTNWYQRSINAGNIAMALSPSHPEITEKYVKRVMRKWLKQSDPNGEIIKNYPRRRYGWYWELTDGKVNKTQLTKFIASVPAKLQKTVRVPRVKVVEDTTTITDIIPMDIGSSMRIARKAGKYGVINRTDNTVVIDFEYTLLNLMANYEKIVKLNLLKSL